MQLGIDEAERVDIVIATGGSLGGRQSGVEVLVGEKGESGGVFVQDWTTVVEDNAGDIAFGIDRGVVGTGGGLLGTNVDLLAVERETGEGGDDVVCCTTRGGGVV